MSITSFMCYSVLQLQCVYHLCYELNKGGHLTPPGAAHKVASAKYSMFSSGSASMSAPGWVIWAELGGLYCWEPATGASKSFPGRNPELNFLFPNFKDASQHFVESSVDAADMEIVIFDMFSNVVTRDLPSGLTSSLWSQWLIFNRPRYNVEEFISRGSCQHVVWGQQFLEILRISLENICCS